ncbi:MAG: ATP-binding cassette domain-containing protein [Oscillospiraceae bacterium]|nr:ATP-binding cassette domain-containing protein [Oscillospiraceae bacterium]
MLEVAIKKTLPGGFALDVEFNAGAETMALLGASGCGKSLTLQCIAGVQTPDEGRITLNGRVLFDSEKRVNLPPQKRKIGYLFQHYALFPNFSVLQNIALGIGSGTRAEKLFAARNLIAAMHLDGLENRKPHELSGGQRQRAALARALATEPEALLLDEPFSALDDYLKWQLELDLADTLRGFRGTAVYVSHSRDEVYRLCGSVSVLQDGKSEKKRAVRDLFHAPETLSAALISGCKNYSRAEILPDGRINALDWGIALSAADEPPEDLKYIGVRAHYIKSCADANAENAVVCRVARDIDDVFGAVLMLETPGTAQLRAEMPKSARDALGEIENLIVQIDKNDIMLLK